MNLKKQKTAPSTVGMTKREILILIEDYLGVYGDGTLRGFSRAKHEAFYHRYCDLYVDFASYEHLSTRKAMIEIIQDSPPRHQAKIVKGVLDMVPVGMQDSEKKEKAKAQLLKIVGRLESEGGVEPPEPENTTETVREALKDAESLLIQRGPKSAVDRAHTALHGYVKSEVVPGNRTRS